MRPEHFVSGFRLCEVGGDVEQAVADRHRGFATAACRECVHFARLVVDDEGDVLNAGLLGRCQSRYELAQNGLCALPEKANVHRVDRIVQHGQCEGRRTWSSRGYRASRWRLLALRVLALGILLRWVLALRVLALRVLALGVLLRWVLRPLRTRRAAG